MTKKTAAKKAAKKPSQKKAEPKKEVQAPPVDSDKEKAPKEALKKEEPKETKLTFKRDEFQKAVSVAESFTEGKNSAPVLSHLLLSAEGRHCKITASDLEVTWSRIIKCDDPKFARCVPATLLLKEVKALPSTISDVVLTFKDNQVSINGRAKLFTLSADDFPVLPKPENCKEVQVDNLLNGLGRVAHAMGDSSAQNYRLSGVFLDFEKKRLVATDGHRLHMEDIGFRGGEVKSVIIPKRAVQLMLKYPHSDIPKLKKEKGTSVADPLDRPATYDLDVFGHMVRVNYKPNMGGPRSFYSADVSWDGPVAEKGYDTDWLGADRVKEKVSEHGSLRDFLQAMAEDKFLTYHKTVTITVSNSLMTSPAAGGEMVIKLLDGPFPNYQNVIPKKLPIKLRFSAAEFLQQMEGAVPLSEHQGVSLKVNGAMVIQTNSPDRGAYRHQMACTTEGKGDKEFVVKFNAQYLITAIKAYPSQEVLLELVDPLSACLVNKKALIMPIRGDDNEAQK